VHTFDDDVDSEAEVALVFKHDFVSTEELDEHVRFDEHACGLQSVVGFVALEHHALLDFARVDEHNDLRFALGGVFKERLVAGLQLLEGVVGCTRHFGQLLGTHGYGHPALVVL